MIVPLSVTLYLCFRGNLFIVVYIFLNVRIWASCSDRPCTMGDIENEFIPLLSTNILSITALELFWIFVAKLTVWNRFYGVNKDTIFFGWFQWDNVCLCLHKLKISL